MDLPRFLSGFAAVRPNACRLPGSWCRRSQSVSWDSAGMFSTNDSADRTPATLRPDTTGRAPTRFGPLIMSATLSAAIVVCIMIAAAAVSMGFARAQTLNAVAEPDTGLVLAMLAAAIGVMGVLSAAAVRLAGRSRQR